MGNDEFLEGQLNDPSALAIEPNTGNVYILDAGWVQVFSPLGAFQQRWSTLPDSPSNGLAFSPEGTLLATDNEHGKVLEYTTEGTLVRSWGEQGTNPGQFNGPSGVVVAANGTIYVADSNNHRIQSFNREGEFLNSWGNPGDAIGNLIWPRSIALDGAGNVYVSDSGNYRIQKFDPLGTWISQWGEWGGANEGNIGTIFTAITVDGPEMLVLQLGYNVQRYTTDGTFLGSWEGEGTERPNSVGIASSQEHVIYAMGLRRFGVEVHDPSGTLLNTFGTRRNSAPGQFADPAAVVVTEDGAILVGERYTGRLQRLDQDGVPISEWSVQSYRSELLDLAVGPDGTIFELMSSTDFTLIFVDMYSSTGDALGKLYGLSHVSGISVDDQGRLWAANEFEHRVSVYLPGEEEPQTTWGEPGLDAGELWQPKSIAARNGTVIVCDSNSISVFDEDGIFQRNLASWKPGEVMYEKVAMGEDMVVLASSFSRGKVSIFEVGGKFRGDLKLDDSWQPLDVASAGDGSVYALTSSSPNLWKFTVN